MTKSLPPNIKKVRDSFPDADRLSKRDLAVLISDRYGVSINTAQKEVDHVLEAMSDSLVAGKGLEFRGFASFSLRKTKAVPARNPRTMEPVEIPPRWKIVFRSSTFIRKMLQLSLA